MDPRVLWALRPYCKQKCCIDEYVCIVTSMISLHAATIWQMLIRLDFFGSNNRLLTMDLGSRIWQIFTHTRKTHTPRQNTAPQNPAHPHEHGWIYISLLIWMVCNLYIIVVAWFLLLRTTSFWPKTAALPLEVLEPLPTAHLRLEDTDQYLTC